MGLCLKKVQNKHLIINKKNVALKGAFKSYPRICCQNWVISISMNMHKHIGIANHKPDSALKEIDQDFEYINVRWGFDIINYQIKRYFDFPQIQVEI